MLGTRDNIQKLIHLPILNQWVMYEGKNISKVKSPASGNLKMGPSCAVQFTQRVF